MSHIQKEWVILMNLDVIGGEPREPVGGVISQTPALVDEVVEDVGIPPQSLGVQVLGLPGIQKTKPIRKPLLHRMARGVVAAQVPHTDHRRPVSRRPKHFSESNVLVGQRTRNRPADRPMPGMPSGQERRTTRGSRCRARVSLGPAQARGGQLFQIRESPVGSQV